MAPHRCHAAALAAVVLIALPMNAEAGNGGWHGGGGGWRGGCCYGGSRFFFGFGLGFPAYPAAPYYYPPYPAYGDAPPPIVYAPPYGAPAYGPPLANGCREYTAPVTVNGQTVQRYGTACPQPDGSWRIIN